MLETNLLKGTYPMVTRAHRREGGRISKRYPENCSDVEPHKILLDAL